MKSRLPRLIHLLVLFALISSVSRSATAQVVRLLDRRPDSGALLPPTSVATEQSAFALGYNPAGLVLGPSSFGYLHEEGDPSFSSTRRSDAVFLGLGGLTEGSQGAFAAGAGMEWVRGSNGNCSATLPCTRRTSLGLAFGGPRLAVGIAWRDLSTRDNADLDDSSTWDAGFVFRPGSWLSIGGLVTAFNSPTTSGDLLPRLYTAGIGLRPFGERLTLAGDFSIDDRDGLDASSLAWLASLRVLPALELVAQVAHPVRDAPGRPDVVALFALRGGLGYGDIAAAGGTGFGGGQGPSGIISASMLAARGPSLFGTPKTAHVLDLDDTLEGPGPLEALLPGRDPLDPATRLALRLQRLSRDDSVGALVLRVRSASGLGTARIEELRGLFAEFQNRGIPVVVRLESVGDPEYLLATGADRILVAPQSLLEINGLSSRRIYLRRILDTLGVTPEFVKAGAYKSAPEQFERSDPSEASEENINWLLDDAFDRYVTTIADSRELTPDQVRNILDEGMMDADRAVEMGLVDGLAATATDVERAIASLVGRRLRLESAGPRATVPIAWSGVPSMALIEVKGTILPGKSGSGTAGADTISRQLRRAAEDPSIRAIVVRIESPGGDVTASELIYAAMQEARERKPVVVSMGDVAASGGYYVAMGADHIVAEPGTITGSIGVFAGKADVSQLLDFVGIGTAQFKRGEHADIMSFTRPWSDEERRIVQTMVDRFYSTFIERVSSGRGLSAEELESLAGGRVWTGAQALERGLVDSLGGLQQALTEARRRAQIPPTSRVQVQSAPGLFSFPEPPSQPFIDPASMLSNPLVMKLAELGLFGKAGRASSVLPFAASTSQQRRLEETARLLQLLDGRPLSILLDPPMPR